MQCSRYLSRFVGVAFTCAMMNGCMLDEGMMDDEHMADVEDIGKTSSAIKWAQNGHDYIFVSTETSWYEARDVCNRGDYELVAIKGWGEQDFVHNKEWKFSGSKWWIGFNDIGWEGSWRWDSGSVLKILNWAVGQPYDPDGSRDCAVDDRTTGSWSAADCWKRNRFICERSTVPANDGSFTFKVSNTSSATKNTRVYPVYLYKGMLLAAGTCGVKGSWRKGDTYLRVKDAYSVQVAANDDACRGVDASGVIHSKGHGSNLAFVAPASGTYYIHAGCYSNNSCEGKVAIRRW